MIEVEINKDVFNGVYLPHLENYTRTQIYYGGSSSGKSVFLAQRDIVDLMKGGRNFLVCRQVGKTLRGSVVQEIKKIRSEWGLRKIIHVNKTDGTVTCSNGYQIVFAGLDDVEKLKSIVPEKGVFTDIRIEEATEANPRTIKQLIKRQRGGSEDTPKRLVLSFNPILRSHWIYKDYFSAIGWADGQSDFANENLTILKTTYKDNKFLTSDDIADLENETDKYFYDVYTLGNWGILGHVIFENWRVADLSGMRDQFTNPRNGLDFGYAADPAALWVSHYDKKRKKIYIYDELYETGLLNDTLAEKIRDKIGQQRVVCDSADPKSIAEIKRYGVNAYGAKKGQGSILHGVQWLQQLEIIIDKRCVNTIAEFSGYKWKEDRDGIPVSPPTPIDRGNHIIDAGRYATEEDAIMRRSGFVEVRGR